MLVITGFQRSGTTALGEQLGALPGFAYWGEVFHPAGYIGGDAAAKLRLRPGANWFRFVEDELPASLRTGPQEAEARTEAWALYTAFLTKLGSGRRPVLDVKYNSWHNLQPVWAPIVEPPFLLDLVRGQDGGFVHLVRGNVLAQALSEVFAHESGAWHRRPGQTLGLQSARFAADTEGLLTRMRESRRETALVRDWLTVSAHIELLYEHTFDTAGRLTEGAQAALADLGVEDLASLPPPVLGRIGHHPAGWLANLEEVREALRGTEFEPLAEETLA
jgi:LPS sulfotransferase NodH